MIEQALNHKSNAARWQPDPDEKPDWFGRLPFIGVHLGALAVLWTGWSWTALAFCFGLYFIRMFGITAGYHRYFSHASYKTSRVFQFLLAWLATSSAQMGPLWWASHHRYHHLFSDTEEDVHSPIVKTIWWAHIGWILSSKHMITLHKLVKDWSRFPELKWLNKHFYLPPISLALVLYFGGNWMAAAWPELGVTGGQLLAWGFFASTVLLYHGTFVINSFCHLVGTQRYETGDQSRNNFFLALITLGEGWHNNHHRYPASERQGFYWWEIDPTHYALKVLSWVRLVWDLRPPADEVYIEAEMKEKLNRSLDTRELLRLGLSRSDVEGSNYK